MNTSRPARLILPCPATPSCENFRQERFESTACTRLEREKKSIKSCSIGCECRTGPPQAEEYCTTLAGRSRGNGCFGPGRGRRRRDYPPTCGEQGCGLLLLLVNIFLSEAWCREGMIGAGAYSPREHGRWKGGYTIETGIDEDCLQILEDEKRRRTTIVFLDGSIVR